MLVKLNKLNKGSAYYDPPFPVVRHFDDIDRSAPVDQQIENLVWIPALLVSRFLYQFPRLHSEADELFSVGLEVVVEEVNKRGNPGDKIGGIIHTNACAAMESYCNNINSIVKVSTRTRYKNREKSKPNPSHIRLTSDRSSYDDNTELILRDAAESLGIDLERMTLKEKRKLAEVLEL